MPLKLGLSISSSPLSPSHYLLQFTSRRITLPSVGICFTVWIEVQIASESVAFEWLDEYYLVLRLSSCQGLLEPVIHRSVKLKLLPLE